METWIVLPDMHWPYHVPGAVECVDAVIATVRPDAILMLGDMLDCRSFSKHPPKTSDEKRGTPWDQDLAGFGEQLKRWRKSTKRVVWLEGNHENRVKRAALESKAIESALPMLLPQRVLRGLFDQWVDYGTAQRFRLARGLYATHGWHEGIQANRKHLDDCTTFSIMHGHTHSDGHASKRDVESGRTMQAWSFGCLYKPQPPYIHAPTRWTHGLGVVHVHDGRHQVFGCKIEKGSTILPDGTLIR